MIRRLRTRPPLVDGQRPPIFTQRIRIEGPCWLRADRAQDIGGCLTLAKNSVPDFEVDEQPQPIVVTCASATVLVGQLPQGVRIEESARSGTRSQNELLDHRP